MRLFRKAAFVATVMVMSGCSYPFGQNSETDELPKRVVYSESEVDSPSSADETIMAELYVIDENNLVVPQAVPIEQTDNEEKAALQYMAAAEIGNGFRTPLPEGTVIKDVVIKGKTAVVSVSGSFADYAPEDEANIAAAITWTVTDFGKADRVQIELDGKRLQTMPIGGMPIAASGMQRKDGINMEASYAKTGATKPLTVYFSAQNEQGPYYVPVTRRISADTKDLVSAAVAELSKGPDTGSGLASEFMPGTKLVEAPTVQKGRAVLHFNEAILENNGEPLLSSRVLKPLALTLAESAGIESIAIQVGGKSNVKLETGEQVPASITAPLFINQQSIVSAE